jgi:hypothetical protein
VKPADPAHLAASFQIIDTIRARVAPMMPASAGLRR